MAKMPYGIESWRKPVVLEKTSTAKLGCVLSASATRRKGTPTRLKTITSDEALAMAKPFGRPDFELTGLRRRHSLEETKPRAKELAMKWKTPVIIEIAVGLEINAYACAEVK
jgi:coenzyme PQQ precursor peptide PqqA